MLKIKEAVVTNNEENNFEVGTKVAIVQEHHPIAEFLGIEAFMGYGLRLDTGIKGTQLLEAEDFEYTGVTIDYPMAILSADYFVDYDEDEVCILVSENVELSGNVEFSGDEEEALEEFNESFKDQPEFPVVDSVDELAAVVFLSDRGRKLFKIVPKVFVTKEEEI